jgi:tetratricopeptide (TPR) repeat protein
VACLSDELVARCAAGALSDAEIVSVEEHVDGCPSCRRLLGELLHDGPATARGHGRAQPPSAARRHERYDVTIELGRGGLGRVVAARDRRLGRTVALKELLDRDADNRARFEREATVTARLQHPSIVPLYDVDSWPDGVPFYVMKVVTGRTLARLIADAATLDQRLALLPNVVAVCAAIAYAHREGIIHRDLKPANVLVGDFGETVVIDWGLAKDLRAPAPDRAPPAAAADPDATVAGTVLGTPNYMAPEQARAEAVDERADVYALGAILYHLLAGAPPYRERSAEATVAAVQDGPPPPLAERQPGVPRDLITIVARAMARDPAARPTAEALADELRRFTTGQLVRSHVYSWPAMARRFVRRNRTAVLVAAVMLGAMVGGGALAVRQIVHARNLAERQRAAAERVVRYTLSETSVRLDRLAQLGILGDIGAQIGRYYDAVQASDARLDDEALGERAATLQILASVRQDEDDLDGALELYRRSVALRERQARRSPDGTDWGEGLLTSLNGISEILAWQDDEAVEGANDLAGLRTAERLAAAHPGDPAWLAWQGRFYRRLTQVGRGVNGAAGLVTAQTALAIAHTVVALTPREVRAQRDLEYATYMLGLVESYVDNDVEALVQARAARALGETLARADPDDDRQQYRLAIDDDFLCNQLYWHSVLDQAQAACRAGAEVMHRLLRRHPSNRVWLYHLALIMEDLGLIQELTGDLQGALATDASAVAIDVTQQPRAPRDLKWSWAASRVLESIGDIQTALGDVGAGRTAFAAAQLIVDPMPAGAVGRRTVWRRAAGLQRGAASADEAAGDNAAAVVRLVAACALLAATEDRTSWLHVTTWSSLARVLRERGALDDALAVTRRAVVAGEKLRDPRDTYSDARLAAAHMELADVLSARADWAGAMTSYRRVLELLERPDVRHDPYDRRHAGEARFKLGAALLATGATAAALVEDRAALANLAALAAAMPADPRVGFVLAQARVETASALARTRGGAAEARGLLAQASSWLETRRAAGRLDAPGRDLLERVRRRGQIR